MARQPRGGTRSVAALICVFVMAGIAQAASARKPFSAYDLLTLTDIAGFALSPAGDRVAFVTSRAVLERNSYEGALYVIDAQRSATPIRLGSVIPRMSVRGGLLDQPPRWLPDGRSIAYIANFDGHDQIWVWDVHGGSPRRLTSQTADVLSFDVVAEKNAIAFTTFEPGASPQELEEWTREAYERGMLVEPPVGWGDFMGRNGVENYVARRAGIRFRRWIYELATRRERPATDQELRDFEPGFPAEGTIDRRRFALQGIYVPPGPFYETTRSPDGTRAAFHTKDHNGPRQSVLSVGQPDGDHRVEWHRAIEGQFSALRWSSRGERLYFVRSQYGEKGRTTGIYFMESPGQAPTRVYETTATVTRVTYDEHMNRAVFAESTTTQPERLVAVDLRSGARHVIYDPNPQLSTRKFPATTLLRWTNEFGEPGYGYLLMPERAGSGRRPPLIVVTYRASGFLRGGTGDEYPIYPLVEEGFAVFVLDVGGVTMNATGRTSESARLARFYSQRATISAAMRSIEEVDVTDEQRRALTGLSFGADTTWQAITHSNQFATAIVSDGGIDPFGSYLRGIDDDRSDLGPLSFLPIPLFDDETRRPWQKVSASANARHIRAPVLLNDSDSEIPFTRQLSTTMQGFGKPFEIHVYPNAGHIINQPKQRHSIYNRNIDWLKFWLMNLEESAKEDQYVRWRLLRRQHEWNERLLAVGRDPASEFIRQREALRFSEPVSSSELAPALTVLFSHPK